MGMLGNRGRSITEAAFTPLARVLSRLRVTPNMITIGGTAVSSLGSVLLLARGYLWQGAILVALVLLLDSVDGILARTTGATSEFGAFLDSTLDRVADGFVFGSLLWWAIMGLPDSSARTTAVVAGIISMTAVGVVPYARARAEACGVEAKVGIAERTDRLAAVLIGAGLFGLGLSVWVFASALVLVALASSITVVQRVVVTYRQLAASEAPAEGPCRD